MVHYASRLRNSTLGEGQGNSISRILETARLLVYACKTLKDVRHDIEQLKNLKENVFSDELNGLHDEFLNGFFRDLLPLLCHRHKKDYLDEELERISEHNAEHHQMARRLVARHIAENHDLVANVSTWFNFNQELHHYVRYMLAATRNQHSVE